MASKCDHACVGVIIEGKEGPYAGEPGQYLMFQRVKPPYGIAPVAGHLDQHGSFVDAMAAETREEVSLEIMEYKLLAYGRRQNVCRRPLSKPKPGHEWEVYHAYAQGIPGAAPEETKDLRWLTSLELQALAERTALYAHGGLTDEEFKADPGMEPVWVQWFNTARIVRMNSTDLTMIDLLTRTVRL